MKKKKKKVSDDLNGVSPSHASSLLNEDLPSLSEAMGAQQRDLEPDDFDFGTDVSGDRVRGAGGQSLAELVIAKDQGWGLEEHGGGLRFDRPEPNVNDEAAEELDEEDRDLLLEAERARPPKRAPKSA